MFYPTTFTYFRWSSNVRCGPFSGVGGQFKYFLLNMDNLHLEKCLKGPKISRIIIIVFEQSPYLSRYSRQIRSRSTLSFFEMIFFRWSTVSFWRTSKLNCPPVVGEIVITIPDASLQPHPELKARWEQPSLALWFMDRLSILEGNRSAKKYELRAPKSNFVARIDGRGKVAHGSYPRKWWKYSNFSVAEVTTTTRDGNSITVVLKLTPKLLKKKLTWKAKSSRNGHSMRDRKKVFREVVKNLQLWNYGNGAPRRRI